MKYLATALIVIAVSLAAIVGSGFCLSPQDDLQESNAIVVISGGETDQRIEEGVKLYQEGWSDLLIVSGAARDEGISNALAMKQIAIQLGVPPQDIVLEEHAQDTTDNARYVQEIINELDLKSIILVTSPYHQRRAYLTFHYFLGRDIKIVNHSARDSAWRKNGWWADPWATRLTLSELQKLLYLPILLSGIK